MTNISTFARNAIAATGALLLSVAFIGAAVGPAAVNASTTSYAQVQASVQANA
jgi:hypothetical protein